MKNANIPIFIPHLACPNDCVFCNQRKIAAKARAPELSEIDEILKFALKTVDVSNTDCDIAFFGGSFTGIPKEKMIDYLKTANAYTGDGKFSGIRLSTRPDYISSEILDILKSYNVKTIELGAQSMNDEVLAESGRGHTSKDVIRASELIKQYGFKLVLQMMTGLPGDNDNGSLKTAEKLADLKPDGVRIYPTIVIRDTGLEKLYQNGLYKPQSLDEAINLCASLLSFFDKRNIPVIRLGLFASEGLADGSQIIAGPFHPAFRELCENKIFFDAALKVLKQAEVSYGYENLIINVSQGCISKMVGQKKCNIKKLKKTFGFKKISVIEDKSLKGFEIKAYRSSAI